MSDLIERARSWQKIAKHKMPVGHDLVSEFIAALEQIEAKFELSEEIADKNKHRAAKAEYDLRKLEEAHGKEVHEARVQALDEAVNIADTISSSGDDDPGGAERVFWALEDLLKATANAPVS